MAAIRIALMPLPGIATLLSATSALAQPLPPVNIVDALTCKLAVPDYMGFALTLGDDDTGYRSRGWVKEESGTPFLSQYRLPAPIDVGGYRTRTIVFSASGVAAVLDVADPSKVAAPLGVVNTIMSREAAAAALGLTPAQAAQLPPVTTFVGERVVSDKTEVDAETHVRFHVRIVQSVRNETAHPGKTLIGCSYSLDPVDG